MKLLLAFCLSIIVGTLCVPGQIPGGSSAREVPTEIQKTDERVEQVIERAEAHFRKGKLYLQDRKRERARDEFDKAVDEVLMSGLDVRASQRLLSFYLELVERIYREEIPQNGPVPPSERIKEPLRLEELYFPKLEPRPLDRQLFKLCNTELFDRANIRGFRLRMSVAEARVLVPSLKLPPPNALGSSEILLRPPFRASNMKGIAALTLSFLDAKIYKIIARYDDAKSWDSGDQFVNHISATFGLPTEWDDFRGPNPYDRNELLKRLECRDSDILAGILVSDYIRKYPIVILTDVATLTDLEKRTEKRLKAITDAIERLRAEDRKRFKP
jgi:hypothetical protein